MSQEPIVLSEIKNKEDLKKILKFISDQGFRIRDSDYNLHDEKIGSIINRANKLNLELDDTQKRKIREELSKIENYSDMVKAADTYFSRFNSEDKIFEVLKWFYLQADELGKIPSHYSPNSKEIVEWFMFKTKHNLTDDYFGSVQYYNFDKNYLKINFNETKRYEFDKMYNLIFGEKNKDYRENLAGEWQDLGKIQIKFFKGGGVNIKGDLTTFKEYLYKNLTKRIYNNYIIKYNQKTEIIKKPSEE